MSELVRTRQDVTVTATLATEKLTLGDLRRLVVEADRRGFADASEVRQNRNWWLGYTGCWGLRIRAVTDTEDGRDA